MMPSIDLFARQLPQGVSDALCDAMRKAATATRDAGLRDALERAATGRLPLTDLCARPDMEALAEQGLSGFRRHLAAMTPEQLRHLEAEGLAEARKMGLGVSYFDTEYLEDIAISDDPASR